MKFWSPLSRRKKKAQDDAYPEGWWIVPLLFVSIFFWAALYILFSIATTTPN